MYDISCVSSSDVDVFIEDMEGEIDCEDFVENSRDFDSYVMYIYTCIYVFTCIYIYMYIYTLKMI